MILSGDYLTTGDIALYDSWPPVIITLNERKSGTSRQLLRVGKVK